MFCMGIKDGLNFESNSGQLDRGQSTDLPTINLKMEAFFDSHAIVARVKCMLIISNH